MPSVLLHYRADIMSMKSYRGVYTRRRRIRIKVRRRAGGDFVTKVEQFKYEMTLPFYH